MMEPAKIDLIDVMARGGGDDQPLTVTLGELRALANPDTVRLNADLVYISKLAVGMRDQVAQVTMSLEDEGDRAYLGSTNDADILRDLQDDIEAWDFERAAFMAERPDLYAQLRELREAAERDPGIEMLREANASFGNYTATSPGVPPVGPLGEERLRSWARRLAEMAQELKDEAAVENGLGNEMLGLLLIRVQLSIEETGEFTEALAEGDLVHVAKELTDMSYVTDGHYLTLGLGAAKLPLYRATHASNMTKLDPVTGKPNISEAGRWIKGPHYRPPDIASVLEQNKYV
jgi:predicted HAD superfamily Cof-like phosphohydrolase